jgi:hypothetical protein
MSLSDIMKYVTVKPAGVQARESLFIGIHQWLVLVFLRERFCHLSVAFPCGFDLPDGPANAPSQRRNVILRATA